MSKERPYEFVSTYAIAYLIEEYKRLVNSGMFRLQDDLNKMEEELNIRFAKPEEDRQISIEEYIRSRNKNGERRV